MTEANEHNFKNIFKYSDRKGFTFFPVISISAHTPKDKTLSFGCMYDSGLQS